VQSGFSRGGWVVILALSAALGLAPHIRGQSGKDFSKIKGEMKVLSAVIDESVAQTFRPPFGILEKTKGTYLPGFGAVFALEVNLYPTPMPTLFNLKPLTPEGVEKIRKVKLERIETMKQVIPRLLVNHAHELGDLDSGESIVVIIHLFQIQSDSDGLPSQIITEVKKQDLDQSWDKKLTYEQYLKQVRIIAY
jgi:hypothetical protein